MIKSVFRGLIKPYLSIIQNELGQLHDITVYSSTYTYPPGSLLFLGGIWFEAYYPTGCLGKNPLDATNRVDGWSSTDPSKPYYWLKIGSTLRPSIIGSVEHWETKNIPQNRILALPDTLNASKYWRLAEVLSDWVVGGEIVFPADIAGQSPKYLDESGVIDDAGRTLGSLQGDAIRNITGNIRTDNGWMFTAANGAFYDFLNGTNIQRFSNAVQNAPSGHSFGWFDFDASRQVPTAKVNRVENYAIQAVRCI